MNKLIRVINGTKEIVTFLDTEIVIEKLRQSNEPRVKRGEIETSNVYGLDNANIILINNNGVKDKDRNTKT